MTPEATEYCYWCPQPIDRTNPMFWEYSATILWCGVCPIGGAVMRLSVPLETVLMRRPL